MSRVLRRFAAVVASVCLLAMLPAPCPCPETAPAPSREHACCAPPTGVSASDHRCCDGHEDAGADLLTPGPVPVPSPTGVAVARVEPVVRLEAAPHGLVVSSSSPPPTVLRI